MKPLTTAKRLKIKTQAHARIRSKGYGDMPSTEFRITVAKTATIQVILLNSCSYQKFGNGQEPVKEFFKQAGNMYEKTKFTISDITRNKNKNIFQETE